MRLPLKRYLTLLKIYLKPQWLRTLILAVLLLSSIGLQLLNPQILRYFIDTAIAGGATTSLVQAGIFFIVVALLNLGVSVATTYFSEYIAWTATNQLRADLVAHCLSLDMSFHKEHTSGELIERIDGDVDALSNFFSQFTLHLLNSMIVTLCILVLFFLIDWRVGVTMTVFSMGVLLLMLLFQRRIVPYFVKLRQVNADFSSFLGERLAATEDIAGNGAAAAVMRQFYLLLRRWLPINAKAKFADFAMGGFIMFAFILGSCLSLIVGAYLWSIGASPLAPSTSSSPTQISSLLPLVKFKPNCRICNRPRPVCYVLQNSSICNLPSRLAAILPYPPEHYLSSFATFRLAMILLIPSSNLSPSNYPPETSSALLDVLAVAKPPSLASSFACMTHRRATSASAVSLLKMFLYNPCGNMLAWLRKMSRYFMPLCVTI